MVCYRQGKVDVVGGGKELSQCHFCTTKLTWIDLVSKPDPRGKRSATNRPSLKPEFKLNDR